jgi:uncharacterized lipoprotein YddW (UPF0748 family)
MRSSLFLAACLIVAAVQPADAQVAALGRYAVALPEDSAPPPVPREFRGVWIATVANLDWPSRPGLPADAQKAELVALLDHAVRLRLNAVVFQVRPAADALYESRIEPWSAVLSGTMGTAPSPRYDPLAFAVAEAHRRGLELHAWFNPYRARYRNERARASGSHISRAMPSVVKRYGPYLWMDPGEPAVRERTMRVILDVVRRYDIDGVHLDDYFYPYPERDRRGRLIAFPDDRSWTRYRRGGGTLERDDWRRRNVDLLIQSLYTEIRKAKPWVRFGISPFGIWRPGYPAPVRGFDQFANLYADARRWWREGWLDYLTPQLYWRSTAPQQPYAPLLAWWAQENVKGRHLWPGNAAYKVTNTGERWAATELADQVRLTRDQPGATGNIHFNMSAFVSDWDAVTERMASGPYADAALAPATPWLSRAEPAAPVVTRRDEAAAVVLDVTAPASPPASPAAPRWWLMRARYPDGWRAFLAEPAVRTIRLGADAGGKLPDLVTVNAIDRVGVESETVYALAPL